MSADDGSLPAGAAAAVTLAAGIVYLLPALAGTGYPAQPYPLPALAPLAAMLRGRLGIADRTATGLGCALTFDDGPHPQGTPAVLAALAAAGGVKATFFLVGEQVRANPSLAAEIVAEGHAIGLHCDRHRNLMRLAPWQVSRDIARAEASIGAATGVSPLLYRPPYGIANVAALRLARRRDWRTLLWSHWGRDWEACATPQSIADLLTADIGHGSVLLLHDADHYGAPGSWRRTVAALPVVLERIEAAGLTPSFP